ncbi:MMPL family transporter [Chitinilyticum litopenaei]|uniref:MMPL family transporter n=1 Tax=Chitinilyticum litopenaei TaxID=1121276 RepID=UPI00041C9644|nr:hypothetical protein [Chitinilyticum litopenaei]
MNASSPTENRPSENRLFAIWLAGVLLIVAWLGLIAQRGLPLQTDLLALLPQTERNPVAQAAIRHLDRQLGERSVLLVGASDKDRAIAAARRAARALNDSGAFSAVTLQRDLADGLKSALAFRYALADPQRLAALESDLDAGLGDAAAQLFGPLGGPRAALLARDPLFLSGDLLARRSEAGVDIEQGIAVVHGEGKAWAVLEARNRSGAFVDHGDGPAPVAAAIAAARTAAGPDAQVLASSIALHADAAAKQAKGEISRIGIGSWLGAILLMWLAFRRFSAIALCLLPLAIATLAATLATVQIMGSIHVLTLVFGASLIGVAIDYGTHCFADSLGADEHWTMSRAVRQLRPALFYGMLTSVTGYLALALAPFPGLREVAVFSSFGLLAAFLTVLMAFPAILRHYTPATRGMSLAAFFMRPYEAIPAKALRWTLLPLAALVLAGLWQLGASDDIRSFYSQDARLAADDARIKSLFARAPESQFYLVEGASADEVLQRENALLAALRTVRQSGQLGGARGLSELLPDTATQRERIAQWQSLLAQPAYRRWLDELGVPPAAIAADAQALRLATAVSPEDWLASPLGRADRVLWLGRVGNREASLVLLSGIRDRAELAALPESAGLAGVSWVDRSAEVSQLMAASRNLALGLSAAALVVMLMILAPRHGWRGAALVLLPAVLAASGALALFGWLGLALNIFSAFALLLVLALGIDYAIFFRESGEDSRQAMLGVALDSSTTLLSFGLLAMSSLPAARSFGLMLLFGISLAFVLAPLARPGDRAEEAR